jgi:hypothetical protein
VALAMMACGGATSDGGGSCPKVTGCGGDVTGTWHVTSMCAKASAAAFESDGGTGLPADCSNALLAAINSAVTTPENASIQFTSDGHYAETGTVHLSYTATYTAACMRALGASTVDQALCSQVGANASNQNLGSATIDAVTCTLSSGGCACNFSETDAFDQSGTFVTQGNELAFDSDQPAPYCVQGTTATLSSAAAGATGTLSLSR